MKKPSKLTLFISLLLLAAVFALTAGTVYAWFSTTRFVSDNTFTPGEFDTSLQLYYWKKDAPQGWTPVPAAGMSGTIYPYFGSMNDMTALPADATVYLRMRVSDPACAYFYYNIIVNEITVDVYRKIDATYTKVLDNAIDYYSQSVQLTCIDSYFYSAPSDTLTPAALASLLPTTASTLAARAQSFSSGEYIDSNQWLYVKLAVRQEEFLSILRRIPAEYMPYSIEFGLHITSDTRTVKIV